MLLVNDQYITQFAYTIDYNVIVMKKYVKPLSTSDVVVCLINQESSPDYTQALKEYLFSSKQSYLEEDREAQQIVLLPHFATEESTEEQLLEYHLKRNNFNQANLVNYESLLSGVDKKMRKIIDNSQSSFEKSNEIMHQMILKLRQFSAFITKERKPLNKLSRYIKDKYLLITKKIIVMKNMQKTLDVMKFWNQSNISRILTIKPENICQHSNIEEVFTNFDQIIALLSERKEQLSNFTNLVSLVGDRKKLIVKTIYKNAFNSIITYSSDSQLKAKIDQYEYIIRNAMISKQQYHLQERQGESIFMERYLPKLIQANILTLHHTKLQQNNLDINIEMARDNVFLSFYQELLKQFQRYFSNWHKVTTYHIQSQTPYKDGFIQHRTAVFQKMLEKLQTSLKFSNKVNSLALPKLIHLYNHIHDFLQAGQQWMGKCKTSLPQIMSDKYQQEINNYFKVKNGQIKSTMLGQFNLNNYNETKLHLISDISRQKISIREEIHNLMTEFETEQVDLSRTSKLNDGKAKDQKPRGQQQQIVCGFSRQAIQSSISLYFQRLNTKFGLRLYKIIVLYELRQQYLANHNQLALIYQHFQYVLMIIYKMCIPTYMKRELQQQIYNEFNRTSKISLVKVALQRGNIDQECINTINQLRHGFLDRSTYGVLYDFVAANSSKYQGISLASYVNVNLYFQEPDKYEPEITLLSQILLTQMSELYILADYLDNLLSQRRFPKPQDNLYHQITNLKDIIASLVLYYFTTFFESALKKFYAQVLPLFTNIKFEVKKLNEFKANLKDYKQRALEIYQSYFNIEKYSRNTCFYVMLNGKQQEYFYKFIIDLFTRIEKVNDNGRMILKQEASQFYKVVGSSQNINEQAWYSFLTLYLQLSQERSQKMILEKAEKMVLNYPLQWWRSNVLWFYNDCSVKEKKEFLCKVCNIYLNRLTTLPKI